MFTQANGLPSDQFNTNSGYKAANGALYFGSTRGLVSFDPAKFVMPRSTPQLYITGIQVDNKELTIGLKDSYLQQSIVNTSSITLPYSLSSLTIDFASLSYTAPEVTRYAYQLDGVDKYWIYLETDRKAYFSQLAPGQYTFRVKASNGQGNWTAFCGMEVSGIGS